MHTFIPAIRNVGIGAGRASAEDIHDEPMLYRASWKFASEMGGALTQGVMELLEADPWIAAARMADIPIAIDTRSHMLMRGMWPAIPGWHCDGLERQGRYGQPISMRLA